MAEKSEIRNPKSEIFWADRVRIIATLMMILVHASGPISEHFKNYDTAWWHVANFWDSVSRPNVPLFVMLSGFLLFSKTYPTGEFFRRRFTRVLLPAGTWMVIYLLFTWAWDGQPATFLQAARMVFEGPVHYHLWFIYLIIGLYCCYPFIEPFVRQAHEKDLLLLLFFCFLAVFTFKIFKTFFDLNQGIQIEFFSNNLFYFVGGYFLGQKKMPDEPFSADEKFSRWSFSRKKMLALSLSLIALGTAVTAAGTYFMGHETATFHPYFYDYLTPNVAAATIGWFLLIRHFLGKKAPSPLEKDFAAASFGVYLSHVLVLYFLNFEMVNPTRWHPVLDVPLTAAMCAFLSFAIIWAIQKFLPPSVSKFFA